MKNEVALIVIYNHKYDKNIPVVEKVYEKRFSNIYHIVPFYTGDKKNVIPVYEDSYNFQGYIVQAYKQYFKKSYKHYFFIADDLILNPVINEDNYKEHFHLDDYTNFITQLDSLPVEGWHFNRAAITHNPYKQYVEIKDELPAPDEARKILAKHKVFNYPFTFKGTYLFDRNYKLENVLKQTLQYVNDKFNLQTNLKSTKYPLVRSYSDIFIVCANDMPRFIHYCGVFAGTGLFVELAIPTALALTSEKIVVESELELQGLPLWFAEDHKILDKYDKKLQKLLDDFIPGVIYLHPIKLSKWDTQLNADNK